jgi:predicted molibdopterin-dependent oxidoreductase YjgC
MVRTGRKKPLMVRMKLNDREIEAPRGSSVLRVAQEQGIDIPTLCYHEALGPYGVCRLCIVEVAGSLPRSLRISCAQQVLEGLVVHTESESVRKNRKLLFELLLARSPDSKKLIELAAKHGVTASRFYTGDTDDNCVRCGLCMRVCRDKIGAYALCFAHRGYNRTITTDFESLSRYCIGCGSCAQVCPTGAIFMEDKDKERIIYRKGLVIGRFELEPCQGCGKPYAPRKYLEFVLKSSDQAMELRVLRGFCPECARRISAEHMAGPPFTDINRPVSRSTAGHGP